jgi:biopolymer transport protein ExbB
MYYGNDAAVGASDAAATWDRESTLVMHFDESSGLPRDATAFGHQAIQSTATQGASGHIDAALALDEGARVRLADSPALGVTADGATIALWLRPDGARPVGNIVEIAGQDARLALESREGFLTAVLEIGAQTTEIRAPAPLSDRRWQHVALTLGRELVLYVDGAAVAQQFAAAIPFAGTVTIGATATQPAFLGSIDDLHLARAPRSADWVRLAATGQGADSKLLAFGEDESRDSGGEGLRLVYTLLSSVDVSGWVVNALLVVMALISFDVLITKGFAIARTRREDADFLAAFDAGFKRSGGRIAEVDIGGENVFANSSLRALFAAGQKELGALLATAGRGGLLSLEALEVVRSALDTAIVEGVNALNSRLVYVTLAIAGGPFFGLLGTVVGVMMTFAAIAAEGDVNVRTIAPGVAAALTTTVMGLLVAIPSLFGYNYVATQVALRTSAMETFSDQFISRTALAYTSAAGRETQRAA